MEGICPGAESSQGATPGGIDLARWDLPHYMRRPEAERAIFWKQAPQSVRAAVADAIRDLPEGHATRVQADQNGWVVEIL